MRVAFVYDAVYPYSKGGVEKRISDVATRLATRGHEIHLIGDAPNAPSQTLGEDSTTFHQVSSGARPVTASGRRSAVQAVGFAIGVLPHLVRGRFDVIETQSATPLTVLVVWLISLFRGFRVVLVWHEVWGRHWVDYAGVVGQVARLAEWCCLRLPITHLAVSETTAVKLAANRVRYRGVVPLGVDRQLVESVEKAQGDWDVISVSRLTRTKNIELLLRAIDDLQDRGVELSLLVVGDGPERGSLEKLATDLDLRDVTFAGEVPEVIGLIKSSRAMAHPSDREGFGLVILEAAACGVPVAAIDHPENAGRELVHPGLLAPPHDPAEFADRIRMAVTEGAVRDAALAHGTKIAEHYELDGVVDRLEFVYQGSPTAEPVWA